MVVPAGQKKCNITYFRNHRKQHKTTCNVRNTGGLRDDITLHIFTTNYGKLHFKGQKRDKIS